MMEKITKKKFMEALRAEDASVEEVLQLPFMYHKIEAYTNHLKKEHIKNTSKGKGIVSSFYKSRTYSIGFYKPISKPFKKLSNER